MNSPLNLTAKLLQPKLRDQLRTFVNHKTLSGPIIIEFDPTSNCNFTCPECISSNLLNKGEIPKDRLSNLLHEFFESGVKGIIFIGGGEPLAHTIMPIPILQASDLGMSIGLTTNGSLIGRYQNEIAERIQWTRVSMDAGNQRTFDEVRPSKMPQSFTKVVKNIEALNKRKKGIVGYSFLIMERSTTNNYFTNCGELIQAAKIAKEIGCDYFEFKPVVDMNHHLIPFSDNMHLLISQQLPQLHELEDDNFRVVYPSSITNLLQGNDPDQPKQYDTCPVLELRTVVTPSGIYPCPYKRGDSDRMLGSIDGNFQEVWNSAARREKSFEINPNKECPFYCIRHESNILLNLLVDAYNEGVNVLPFLAELAISDVFI